MSVRPEPHSHKTMCPLYFSEKHIFVRLAAPLARLPDSPAQIRIFGKFSCILMWCLKYRSYNSRLILGPGLESWSFVGMHLMIMGDLLETKTDWTSSLLGMVSRLQVSQ